MPTVPGFVHRPGAHCGSTALRDLAESCAGVVLSEAMCFGLGAGLGFAYLADPALSPSHGFCGRAPYLEPHFFFHLGVPFSWHNAPLPWEELRQCVDAGQPVLALTDLYYLDYYASTVHFGGHAVIAAGYTPGHASGTAPGGVLLADTAWPDLQEVPYAHFRQAMHSVAPPFPVDGQWTPVRRFAIPEGVLPAAVRAALATCARSYLHAPPPPEFTRLGVRHYGISGLRRMATSLPSWADAPDFAWCCRFAYQMIEKRGTGGSTFRRMYAAFLREAHTLVPALPVTAVAEMERATALWSEAAALFRNLAVATDPEEPPSGSPAPPAVGATLRRIADILLEAASHEEEALMLVASL
ncbi:MAG: BtrH N-terminal domain-containing protein [Bacillota bacterium]|nr:BtrH N-terminal domain-containing protein [Bacillota bacterium]